MNHISQSIKMEHSVVWKSPGLNSLEEAELIIIPERHNNLTQKVGNGFLINNISLLGPYKNKPEEMLILLEKPREFVDKSGDRNNRIHDSIDMVSTPITCMGWDNHEDFSTNFKDSYIFYNETRKINNNEQRNSILLNGLKKIFKDSNEFDVSDLRIDNASNIIENFKSMVSNKLKYSFQNRNNSLIETLSKTKKLAKLRFVIGGTAHFINISQMPSYTSLNYPEFSLDPLYKYLLENEPKTIVVLHNSFK